MDAFIGEIRAFTGNYAPNGWAFCDGSLLNVSQNSVLFSVIGNKFGGDGKSTFALPNFTGKVPMGQGQGQGLSNRAFGQEVGTQTEILTEVQMPAHTHLAQAAVVSGSSDEPVGKNWSESIATGRPPVKKSIYDATPNTQMSPQALAPLGGNGAHNNMQPFLALNFIICVTEGVYPPKQ